MEKDSLPKIRVLTGLPGTGESTTSDILKGKLSNCWKFLHADDYNNETKSKYGGTGQGWPNIRQYRPILIGKKAGLYLSQRKNVLIEGNLKDKTEIKNLCDSTRKAFQNDFNLKIILLKGEFEMLVKRCVSEKGKDMRDQGVDEEVGCRSYLKNVCPQNDIADIIIYVDDKTKEDIANEVLKKGDF